MNKALALLLCAALPTPPTSTHPQDQATHHTPPPKPYPHDTAHRVPRLQPHSYSVNTEPSHTLPP
ncbi:hypothetical protein, partial [Achromobacter ruhlandii]|uniref:hypothetical protein n=1 Tax=Achromobacter ruhlandii TaxID=72557 RepID=UPI001B8BCEAE